MQALNLSAMPNNASNNGLQSSDLKRIHYQARFWEKCEFDFFPKNMMKFWKLPPHITQRSCKLWTSPQCQTMQQTMLYNILIPKVFTIRPDFEKNANFDLFFTDSRGRRKDPLLPRLILLKECSILLFKSLCPHITQSSYKLWISPWC